MCGYVGGRVDLVLMRLVDILYSVPTLLYVILIMLVFGAIVLIDPGENYSISRMDENFRDRFAFNSLLIQGDETTPDDLSGLEDMNDPNTEDGTDDSGSESSIAGYAGIAIAVLIVIAIAAALAES